MIRFWNSKLTGAPPLLSLVFESDTKLSLLLSCTLVE
jgi:hypothetical protein